MTDDFTFKVVADRGLEPFLEFAFAGRKAKYKAVDGNVLFLAESPRYNPSDSADALGFEELEQPMNAEDAFPTVLAFLKDHRPDGLRDEDEDKGWFSHSGSAYGGVILQIRPVWVTYSK